MATKQVKVSKVVSQLRTNAKNSMAKAKASATAARNLIIQGASNQDIIDELGEAQSHVVRASELAVKANNLITEHGADGSIDELTATSLTH